MSDLVQRLRNFCIWNARHSHYDPVPVCQEGAAEIERLREALTFARQRIVYYGTISDRRHFDHDLAEVYPKIDAAFNQQNTRD